MKLFSFARDSSRDALRSPGRVKALGHFFLQEPQVILTLALIVLMGILNPRFLTVRNLFAESAALLKRLKINFSSPRLKVERMSGGQRQMVAAAKAIAFDAKILLMDEPTAALGVRKANTLLRLIKDLRDEGHSVVLITQRVPDILAIGDRVMVLKGGRRQGVLEVSEVGLDDVVELIVRGREGAESDEEAMEYLSLG
jgi:simple sugar transport system ATP-binding protein